MVKIKTVFFTLGSNITKNAHAIEIVVQDHADEQWTLQGKMVFERVIYMTFAKEEKR